MANAGQTLSRGVTTGTSASKRGRKKRAYNEPPPYNPANTATTIVQLLTMETPVCCRMPARNTNPPVHNSRPARKQALCTPTKPACSRLVNASRYKPSSAMSCVADATAIRKRIANEIGKNAGNRSATASPASAAMITACAASTQRRRVRVKSTTGPQNNFNIHGNPSKLTHNAIRAFGMPRSLYKSVATSRTSVAGIACMT